MHLFRFKKRIFSTLISPDRPLAIPPLFHQLDSPEKDYDGNDRKDINSYVVIMKILLETKDDDDDNIDDGCCDGECVHDDVDYDDDDNDNDDDDTTDDDGDDTDYGDDDDDNAEVVAASFDWDN